MLQTALFAMRAILPILLLMAMGYAARRIGPWDLAFFKKLNKLGFCCFMPMNLFCNIYQVEDLSQINLRLTGAIVAGIFLCMAVGILVARLLPERSQRGVLVQAATRSNQAILGLPLANALGGAPAMAFASIVSSVTVPVFNILGVLVLVCYGGDKDRAPSIREMLRRIVTNPLILGAAAGVCAVLLRQTGLVPAWFLRDRLPSVYKAVYDLNKIASPIMLFVLGACLDFRATGRLLPQIALGVFLRLILDPVLVIGGCLLLHEPLGLTAVEVPSLVAVFASPVAVASAVMVQEIGGDDQLASQLVVWTSVCSLFTIFAIVFVLRSIGAL